MGLVQIAITAGIPLLALLLTQSPTVEGCILAILDSLINGNNNNACPTVTITNGEASYSDDKRPVDSEVSFLCNDGYELVGAQKSTCQSGSTWSPDVPTCEVCRDGWTPVCNSGGDVAACADAVACLAVLRPVSQDLQQFLGEDGSGGCDQIGGSLAEPRSAEAVAVAQGILSGVKAELQMDNIVAWIGVRFVGDTATYVSDDSPVPDGLLSIVTQTVDNYCALFISSEDFSNGTFPYPCNLGASTSICQYESAVQAVETK